MSKEEIANIMARISKRRKQQILSDLMLDNSTVSRISKKYQVPPQTIRAWLNRGLFDVEFSRLKQENQELKEMHRVLKELLRRLSDMEKKD